MLKKRPKTAQAKEKEPVKIEKAHPKQALMERLASGRKHDISQKDMHKLTSKNYNELPEVKRKREEENKKMEM